MNYWSLLRFHFILTFCFFLDEDRGVSIYDFTSSRGRFWCFCNAIFGLVRKESLEILKIFLCFDEDCYASIARFLGESVEKVWTFLTKIFIVTSFILFLRCCFELRKENVESYGNITFN